MCALLALRLVAQTVWRRYAPKVILIKYFNFHVVFKWYVFYHHGFWNIYDKVKYLDVESPSKHFTINEI
jgi:hypothetical protein